MSAVHSDSRWLVCLVGYHHRLLPFNRHGISRHGWCDHRNALRGTLRSGDSRGLGHDLCCRSLAIRLVDRCRTERTRFVRPRRAGNHRMQRRTGGQFLQVDAQHPVPADPYRYPNERAQLNWLAQYPTRTRHRLIPSKSNRDASWTFRIAATVAAQRHWCLYLIPPSSFRRASSFARSNSIGGS